jgi:hypothetical protein
MMAFVPTLAAIGRYESDSVADHAIDSSDVNTVGPDDLHVLLDAALLHVFLLGSGLFAIVCCAASLEVGVAPPAR